MDVIDIERIYADKEKILKDRAELVEQKNAFFAQTSAMTKKIEKAEKLYTLAMKMKEDLDLERSVFAAEKKKWEEKHAVV